MNHSVPIEPAGSIEPNPFTKENLNRAPSLHARRRDHLLVLAIVLPAPATTAGALLNIPPPGTDGPNLADLGSNRGLTGRTGRCKWTHQPCCAMDGLPCELSSYPRSDSPSGYHLLSGESEHSRFRYYDLQDVCMAIESLTTPDLPMIVDSIGIYELKGPYYTLTMIEWFLQALSVIPRGSWGDVARRFNMVRWGERKTHNKSYSANSPPLPPPAAVAAVSLRCDRPGKEILIAKSSLGF
ncbi:hypothetical protein F511_16635 [Dorcoceras hygrometricum]|uniref:Uncharacterized protein n=1 Tax=Dorcoceras hygrometricum TaxID=472368 RepID=A0A2Z7A9D2_9LAMI|nr:hypothetical protein F511_16635 [Dorcoceras hygrometricum]